MSVGRLGLVCCSKEKLECPAPAKDMYVSRLFRLRRKVVEATCDDWRILSSRGMLHPTAIIEPYDEFLKYVSTERRKEIQREYLPYIIGIHPKEVVIHAGGFYVEPVLRFNLESLGIKVSIPYQGLNAIQTYALLKMDAEELGISLG